MTAIQERIKELTSQAALRAGVSIERVLNELAKIGFANLSDSVYFADGKPEINVAGLSRDQWAAIGKVSTTTRGDATKVEVTLLDKMAALVNLGRHLGMFVDKTETKVGMLVSVDARVPV